MKIAIIGMSGLFPGSSTNEEFWNNLMQKKDLIRSAEQEDFGNHPEIFYHSSKGTVDKCYSLRGGYIRNFKFDAEGYQLDAAFLAKQDKLYQWALHVAKAALSDSGYAERATILKRCGLILGNLSFPTSSSHRLLASIYTQTTERVVQQLLADKNFKIRATRQALPQNKVLSDNVSQMVSKALGLGGGHYALDAACASSLYAIKLACDELVTGKTDLMLAGAVCAADQLFIHMGFSIFQAYAPDDQKFAPLDRESGGLVSSEGAAVVVLKRLEEAQRDGDTIWGVIGGIGLSNDGLGKFLLSPNPKGQRLAFERAYNFQDLFPHDTSYLECHATGTPLGDRTELNSIATYFEQYQTTPLLGSVKSNVGHLLTVAGMTGLFKVLLALQKGIIPPNINLNQAIQTQNQWIKDEHIINETTIWHGQQAGINSFGFGGTNAHMVVQKYQQQSTQNTEKIALVPLSIVGMAVHFGTCSTLDDFYALVYNGSQIFTTLPKNRWKGFEANAALLEKYGFEDGKAPKGAYIKDFEIDLLRYKIQPQEAETLEPQQALILKVADRALKDAGIEEGQNVAVLIAMETELAIHHYLARWDSTWQIQQALKESGIQLSEEQEHRLIEQTKNGMYFRKGQQTPSQHTSFVGNIMASRIANLWDFSGPAFTVSCGENSVFKALEIAQNLLSLGEVDAVLVGGVDLSAGLEHVLLRNRQSAVNTKEKPSLHLNHDDQGWLLGEGAGAVVLKNSKNTTTKDTIYAELTAIGSNLPSQQIAYQELATLDVQQPPKLNQPIAVGSVQSNIGYTGAASGIASLIKTVLCIYYRFIPGIPNWEQAKAIPKLDSYYFPLHSRTWVLEQHDKQRQALVSGSEGLGVLVSESPDRQEIDPNQSPFSKGRIGSLFILRGKNKETLVDALRTLEEQLDKNPCLAKLAAQFYQLAKNKMASDYCICLVAKTTESLLQEIRYFQEGLTRAFLNQQTLRTPKGSYFTANPLARKGKVAFVYSGSATLYRGLGQDLFQLFPHLHTHFTTYLQSPHLDTFLASHLLYPKTKSKTEALPNIQEHTIDMMSSGVFFASAYTHILRNYLGLEPDSAFGYSMGECSSMWYALGLWSPRHTAIFRNSPIFQSEFAGQLNLLAKYWGISPKEAQKRWGSWIVLKSKEEVLPLIKQHKTAFLTFVNTDREVIISGDKAVCTQIVKTLGTRAIKVPFQNIIHHDFCKAEYEGLIEMHNFQLQSRPKINFYSSLSLDKLPLDSRAIAENSTKVCCQAVDFPSVTRAVYEDGHKIFIELGANSTCSTWIRDILKDKEHLALGFNRKGKSDAQGILEALAQLVSHGLNLNLDLFYPDLEETKKTKSFYKKITLGGQRIYDLLLSQEMKAQFKQLKRVEKKPANTTIMDIQHSESTKGTTLDTAKEKTADSKKTKSSQRFGENGLILQDYESPDHLKGKTIIFSQEDLVEFAKGKIASVFGQKYQVIDGYKRRVRLPMHPYLLVSRVTQLKAKTGVYKPSRMQTEYDIPYGVWYTTDRQIPWAVSVESGQCDLLLIAYLGIDFENQGNLVYRLLDCTLTFVDDLPFEGQTLRYDISINSFVRNGANLLFFFSYNCYVQDRLVLKMRKGCAGFFTDEQLAEGNGVVYTDAELKSRQNAKQPKFIPLLKTDKTSFSKADLQQLIHGAPEKCFENRAYFPNGRNKSLRLPPEQILMLDRITHVDLEGGAYGLGLVIAEKDLTPSDWYFPCHFRNDEVLAGSLQAEGGGNLLRFFMLMLGLQRLVKDARYQPVFDLPQKVRCRKQVVPQQDTKLIYKLEVKKIGLVPNPYVIADLEIISNDIVTVHFENLGLQLREKKNPKYLEKDAGIKISPRSEGALLNELDITNFALDHLSTCFGSDFSCYDGRRTSRQPNTDLQLISRVLKIEGERLNFKQPAVIHTEYDVPTDAWYYQQNSNNTMPYSILMEIALQPCGLLGTYLGSILLFKDKNLYFRNLDGNGHLADLHQDTDFRGKTIHNKAVLVSSVALGGTILQNYTFELRVDGKCFYTGKSSFGFFPAEALAQQTGLDSGQAVPAWYQSQLLEAKDYMQIKYDSLYGRFKLFKTPEGKPHYKLSAQQLLFLDELKIVKNGGKYGKGYIHASKAVQSYDWFFTCHFYQDPVMPGSLGIEAILQAMQTYALQQDWGKNFQSPKFVQLDNHETKWQYRGQILQNVEFMHCEVHFKTIERRGAVLAMIGDAYLWSDALRIYRVTDLALGIKEA